MSVQEIREIREIREILGEKLWGKSADEMNALIKPNVDEMRRRIDELRRLSQDKAQGQV